MNSLSFFKLKNCFFLNYSFIIKRELRVQDCSFCVYLLLKCLIFDPIKYLTAKYITIRQDLYQLSII